MRPVVRHRRCTQGNVHASERPAARVGHFAFRCPYMARLLPCRCAHRHRLRALDRRCGVAVRLALPRTETQHRHSRLRSQHGYLPGH